MRERWIDRGEGLFIIETTTNKLVVDRNEKNYIKLNIEYNISILDLFKGRNEINILIEYNI